MHNEYILDHDLLVGFVGSVGSVGVVGTRVVVDIVRHSAVVLCRSIDIKCTCVHSN